MILKEEMKNKKLAILGMVIIQFFMVNVQKWGL